MPRLVNRNPKYRLHKASGRAVVTLNGEDIYLGAFNSKASRQKYDKVIAEWLSRGRQSAGANTGPRVSGVIKAYWEFASGYYTGDSGRAELDSIRLALAILRRTYGDEPADNFGPLGLQVAREKMVERGWSRGYVNAQIGRLKRCFKWACSRELIAPSLYHGLKAVEGLRQGKTDAREAEPVKPVPEEWVEAALPHLSRQIAGMVRLQLATGMRPGEVCIMRTGDIDTTGDVWVYRPERHKTAHRGHHRVIHLGPKAQAIVEEFLKPDLKAYLFSPADATREWRESRHAARKTPISYGNAPGTNRVSAPNRKPAARYSVGSYRQAIVRACDLAFPPPDALKRLRVKGKKAFLSSGSIKRIGAKVKKSKARRWETPKEWEERLGEKAWEKLQKWLADHRWHPHQLRHNAATRLRKQYGLEAARVVLGHRSAAVAEIYAEIDQTKAKEIMGQVG